MKNETILLDGAMGTLLWEKARAQGFPKTSAWRYQLEHPEILKEVHKQYIEAGSEILCANTFAANRTALKREGFTDLETVIKEAVRIAKEAREEANHPAGKPVRIFLDVGPLSEMLEPYGDMEEDECEEIYQEIIDYGKEAGVDGIFLETFMDLNMMEIAATVAVETGLPVFASMTFEKVGRTLFGNRVDDIAETLEDVGVQAIGLNCSVGPKDAAPIIKALSECTDLPLICKPNSGIPQDDNVKLLYPYTASTFADEMKEVLPYVSYIGGCCGSDVSYIEKIRELL